MKLKEQIKQLEEIANQEELDPHDEGNLGESIGCARNMGERQVAKQALVIIKEQQETIRILEETLKKTISDALGIK